MSRKPTMKASQRTKQHMNQATVNYIVVGKIREHTKKTKLLTKWLTREKAFCFCLTF